MREFTSGKIADSRLLIWLVFVDSCKLFEEISAQGVYTHRLTGQLPEQTFRGERRYMRMLLIALVVISSCSHVSAAQRELIDQSNFLPESGSGGQLMGLIERSYSQGQTFTPSIEGQLSRVEIGVVSGFWEATDDLHVEIRRLMGGIPSLSAADVLGHQVVAYAEIPRLADVDPFKPYSTVSVDFAADFIQLVIGVEYALVLTSDTTHTQQSVNAYSWWSSNQGDNSYLPGTSLGKINTGPNAGPWRRSDLRSTTSTDKHFATYMFVPEPETLTMLVVASFAQMMFKRTRM